MPFPGAPITFTCSRRTGLSHSRTASGNSLPSSGPGHYGVSDFIVPIVPVRWSGVSPSGLGKDRSFRGCALRYLGSTLYMLDAGASG